MDIIYIKELKISTIVGVYDWERTTRQEVRLNLEMAVDTRGAAETDDLQYALDYDAVAGKVMKFVSETQFHLIETLAEQVVKLVMTEFGVPWVRLCLSKPGAIENASDLRLIIERGHRT